jgi:hypothetical protein
MKPDADTKPPGRPPRSGGRRRVVRDSFTMPDADHRLIREMQITYARVGVLLNKGEVLRAGLHALKRMSAEELAAIAERIEHLRTGRAR